MPQEGLFKAHNGAALGWKEPSVERHMMFSTFLGTEDILSKTN